MSTYDIPQAVLDSLKTGEGEQPGDTTGDDPPKDKTTDGTKTNAKGESTGDGGEGNGPSKKGDPDEGKEPSKPKEPTSVKLNGKEYGLEDLGRIVKEHQEDTDWKKSNTERAQSIAAQSKAIEGVSGVLEKILQDKDALEILEDMGYTLDPKALSAVKAAKDTQTTPVKGAEDSKDLKQMKADLNEMKFREDVRDLTGKDEEHRKALGAPEKVEKFLAFMVDHNLLNLEKAYDLYIQADRLKVAEEELEKGKKKGDKPGPKAPVGQGAKDIVTDFKPESRDFGYDAARKATLKLFKR